jgi:hypothetical protein
LTQQLNICYGQLARLASSRGGWLCERQMIASIVAIDDFAMKLKRSRGDFRGGV